MTPRSAARDASPVTERPPAIEALEENVAAPLTASVLPTVAAPAIAADASEDAPAESVLAKAAACATPNVPAIVVLPVPSATMNLLVSIVKPPLRAVAPLTPRLEREDAPAERVLAKAAACATLNVPAIAVLPVPSATTNLSVSIDKPPLRAVPPLTARLAREDAPATARVLSRVAAPVTSSVPWKSAFAPDIRTDA